MTYDPNPPSARTDIVTESTNSVLGQFLKSNALRWIIAAFGEQLQELENSRVALALGFSIEYGEGIALDILGKWIGAYRKGLSDEDFRAVLRATVLLRRSHGRVDDLYAIARAVYDAEYRIHTLEPFSIYSEICGIWDTISIDIIFDFLHRGKQAGTELSLSYQLDADEDTLEFASGSTEESSDTQGLADDSEVYGGLCTYYKRS